MAESSGDLVVNVKIKKRDLNALLDRIERLEERADATECAVRRSWDGAPVADPVDEPLDDRIETLLGRYDVKTDDGFSRAMREIGPILRQSVAAEPWIHRLAQLRSGVAAERVAFHEEDIRRRIRCSSI